MTSRAVAIPLDPGLVESFRALAALGAAVGGDCALAAEMIAARLATVPSARLMRRDDALRSLATLHAERSIRATASKVAAMLRQYETTRWRRERVLTVAPLTYGEEGALLHKIMRNSDARGAPGFETVRNAIAEGVGKNRAVANTHFRADGFSGRKNHRGEKLLDRPKINLEPDAMAALTALANSPQTKKIVADDKAAKVAARRKLLAELHALDAGAEAEYLRHDKAEKAAIAKRRAAELALRDADAELRAVSGAKSEASLLRSRRRERIERDLIEGADLDAIAAFREQMLDEQAKLLRPGNIVLTETVDRNEITRTSTRNVYSNTGSIKRRLAAIRDAFAKVDELKLLDDQSKLVERFAEIRAAFPPVDTMPNIPGKVA